MDMLIETLFEEERWRAFGLDALADKAARATLLHLDLPPDGFLISLLACDDARIAGLNTDFRGKPAPTNVLSWPSEERGAEAPGGLPDLPDPGTADEPEELGDIAISWETCMAEAAQQGKPAADHVTHLIVHGVMHLLGYDHIDEEDARLMEGHETQILAAMGLPDPY